MPFQLALVGAAARSDRQPNIVPDQPVKQSVDAAEFRELVEDQLHHAARLVVGIEGNFVIR